MAYLLDPNRSPGSEVHRIAQSQAAQLDSVLRHPERLGIEESIHDARKHAKKLRALAQLVRPALGRKYAPINEAFRDAARELAEMRDAHVMAATLDSLVQGAPDHLGRPDVGAARAALTSHAQHIQDSLDNGDDRLAAARALSAHGARLFERRSVDGGFEVIAGGLTRTYGRFRSAFRSCGHEDSTYQRSHEVFHEWRKHAKYHRYHLELLRGAYPEIIGAWIDEMRRLTDALGEDHDLWVLAAAVRARPADFGGDDEADAISVLAEARGALLRDRALSLGVRLAAEDPDHLADRLHAWWPTAQRQR